MNIMKLRPLFLAISSILIISSIFSIIFWGFKPSIEFTGGSVWQIDSLKLSADSIQEVFTQNKIEIKEIDSPSDHNYLLKFNNINPEQKNLLDNGLKKTDPEFKEVQFESVGPTLGKELLQKTVYAVLLSSFFLFLFIGRRFRDFSFGASAVLAMLHDTIILIGSFSILGHFFGTQLDALFVTALLTTLSSSVHDTVVTFDRIRELKRLSYQNDWVSLSNQAVTETLTRSINNSMTIIFMLLSLVLLGGSTTRWFATALLIGVVCGTYSSTAVAIPLVLIFKKHSKKK